MWAGRGQDSGGSSGLAGSLRQLGLPQRSQSTRKIDRGREVYLYVSGVTALLKVEETCGENGSVPGIADCSGKLGPESRDDGWEMESLSVWFRSHRYEEGRREVLENGGAVG